MDEKDYREVYENKEAIDSLFRSAMKERLKEWENIAEAKLKGTGVSLYVNLGNDDPTFLNDLLNQFDFLQPTEGKVIPIRKFEMISFGYVNPTPWHTEREMNEEEIEKTLKLNSKGVDMPKAILNFHAPPYESKLDLAPKLNKDLRMVTREGDITFVHVGSRAVRRFIEENQPPLSLHGHIHESRAWDRIGRTISINPGSQFSLSNMNASIITLGEEGKISHQFISG